MNELIRIGLTGGIATGKSTFLEKFLEFRKEDVEVFDSDQTVKQLLSKKEIIKKVVDEFSVSVLKENGDLNKEILRDLVFSDPSKKKKLEGILHPRVREKSGEALENALNATAIGVFIADVPLFFETEFPLECDFVVVVALDETSQIKRLIARNQIDKELAQKMIDAQLPLSEKIRKCTTVIWNGGSLHSLERQAAVFSQQIDRRLNERRNR